MMLVTARNKDNTPYDFTGHTFRMQIRKYSGSSTLDVDIPDTSFTIQADDDGIAAGVNNQFLIEHDKAEFLSLLPIEYKYDIEITDADGKVFTPIYGPFLSIHDITE